MNGDYRGECCHCNGEVRGLCARELTCWEIERSRGGANQISGPKTYSGRIAHTWCHADAQRRIRNGIADGQQSLA